MRLTDLNPEFVGAGGDGVEKADGSPAPRRRGVGVLFNWTCGNHDESHQCYVAFANPWMVAQAFTVKAAGIVKARRPRR